MAGSLISNLVYNDDEFVTKISTKCLYDRVFTMATKLRRNVSALIRRNFLIYKIFENFDDRRNPTIIKNQFLSISAISGVFTYAESNGV